MENSWIQLFILLSSGWLLLKELHATDFVLDTMKKDGYMGESHNVTTEDGYILTIHRIKGRGDSPPVLIIHGLLFSSAAWVILGPKRSLPYLLAEEGFDVWLGNVRGNNYGAAHVNMSSDDPYFWKFTFHEMGIYDLPAMIGYISELRKSKIYYIGHSQGTQTAFIMTSRRPEYAKKICLITALAPIAYLNKLKGILRIIRFIFQKFIPIDRIIYPTPALRFLERTFCIPSAIQSYLCQIIAFSFVGFNFEQFDSSNWEGILQGTMAGTSFRNMIHYAQHVENRRFAEYDYGEKKNKQVYNQPTPPIYDLTRVNVPTVFFCSKVDWLAIYSDAIDVYEQLPQKEGFFTIKYEKFTHCDFVWAKNVKEMLYDDLISLLNSHRDLQRLQNTPMMIKKEEVFENELT